MANDEEITGGAAEEEPAGTEPAGTEPSETGTEDLTPHGAVEELIETLSGSGIPFTRDMWVDENDQMSGTDFGVVEISGTPRQLWGDGRLIEQTIKGNVVLYVQNGSEANVKAIQNILREQDMSFYLESTEYVESENANRWTWRFEMEEYLLESEENG